MIPQLVPGTSGDFEWDAGSVIKAMIFTGITLCTIGGNGMVLLAMIFNRKNLKSSTHYFIASLSLADFLVGVLVMPFLAVLSVSGKWYFGEGYCRAFHCIHYWLCSASILSITAICIERFVGVRYPLQHFKFMNIKRVMQACGTVWIIAGLLSVPPLFIWEEPFTGTPLECPVNFQVGHVVTVMVFMFYIPCLIMLGFYTKIFLIATAHLTAISERRKKTHGVTSSNSDSGLGGRINKNDKRLSGSTSLGSATTNSTSGNDYSEMSSNSMEMLDDPKKSTGGDAGVDTATLVANRQKQTSLSKKLMLVVGAFFICYFPFFTSFMVKAIRTELVPDQLFVALGWIRYFNSCLNPIIYAAMLKPFRDAFVEIFRCVPCQRK